MKLLVVDDHLLFREGLRHILLRLDQTVDIHECGTVQDAIEIAKQITQYSQQVECDVALVPIGYCHDDDKALKRLAAVSNGAFKYIGVRSVRDMLSVLAACDTFLGTSMHANITAFSFGIPHLVGPLAVDKLGGFLDITGLDPALRLNTWAEAADKLQWVDELGANYFEGKAATAKNAVHKTFDQLVQAINP